MRVKISEIRVKNRIRQDVGDITALKDSMRRVGLLQPILIDTKNNLVAGFRRLESAQALGWESIEVKLVDTADKKERLILERDENITRKDFTADEILRSDKLLERYSKNGFFWRLIAWLVDFFERIFRRG